MADEERGGGEVHQFRIFLSSPGDVSDERVRARDLLLGLARGTFVRGQILIDVVSWDDPHGPAQMDARFSPQDAIERSLPPPAECDLTVVLLWGRMGTPLGFKKPDGTAYLSGTEWEIASALAAGKPVLIYRRGERLLLDPSDPDFDNRLAQKRSLDRFFHELVRADGSMRTPYTSYASVDDLMVRLRQDVEPYLKRALTGNPTATQDAPETNMARQQGVGPKPDVERHVERDRRQSATTAAQIPIGRQIDVAGPWGSEHWRSVVARTAAAAASLAVLVGLCYGAKLLLPRFFDLVSILCVLAYILNLAILIANPPVKKPTTLFDRFAQPLVLAAPTTVFTLAFFTLFVVVVVTIAGKGPAAPGATGTQGTPNTVAPPAPEPGFFRKIGSAVLGIAGILGSLYGIGLLLILSTIPAYWIGSACERFNHYVTGIDFDDDYSVVLAYGYFVILGPLLILIVVNTFVGRATS